MDMKRKTVGYIGLIIAISFLAVVLLGGCSEGASKGQEKPVTLFIYDPYGGDATKDSVFAPEFEKFKEAHPMIKFESQLVVGDDVRTRIKVDAASGKTPDVFGFGAFESMLGAVAAAGIPLEADKYFEKSKTTKRSDYPAASLATVTVYDGKTYSIPNQGYQFYFMVNKELFQKFNLEYPETYEELLAVSKVFSDNGIVPLAVGSKGGNPSHFFYSELYVQLPGALEELKALKTSYKFDTDNAYRIAEVIDEMRRNKVFPKDTIAGGDWGPSFSLFAEEKAAMLFSFTFVLGGFPEEMRDKVEIIDVPRLPDGVLDPAEFTHASTVGGWVISKKAWEDEAKQAAIIEFVDWLTSVELMNIMATIDVMPMRKEGLDPSNLTPMYKRILEYNKDKEVVPCHMTELPDANSFSVFQTTLDELWAGSISPKDFVDKVQKSVEEAKN